MELDAEKKKLIGACVLLGIAALVLLWQFWPSGSSDRPAGAGAAPVVSPNAPGAPPRRRGTSAEHPK